MCAWDMYMHMCTCIWTHTALDTHIRAYEWTHTMLMHISTFTYTHVPRCICWHKHNICVHMHTHENVHLFPHIYVLCPYVYVHMYIFVHMYDFKWSKQSIDLCSNEYWFPLQFHFNDPSNRTIDFHHTHLNFSFYFSRTIKAYFSDNHFFLILFCLDH